MDAKVIAFNGLKGAIEIFRKDIEAIPDEAFSQTFDGATRSAADIVYEVVMVNDHVGCSLRGESTFDWPDGWLRAPEALAFKQESLKEFDRSSASILSTVEAFSSEEMEIAVETEHGTKDRFERCRFMTLHLWYHSGQLNYIQTLIGDDKWHWN